MHVWKHLKTVNRHRRLVRRYCFRLGLYRQGLIARPEQVQPHGVLAQRQILSGLPQPQRRRSVCENGVSLSWLHHKGRNRHHFEYWIDYCIGSDGTVYMGGCKMPKKYVAEMFCDRIAACRVYQGDEYTDASAYDYYHAHQGAHSGSTQETAALLGRWLLLLKEQGEDAAFRLDPRRSCAGRKPTEPAVSEFVKKVTTNFRRFSLLFGIIRCKMYWRFFRRGRFINMSHPLQDSGRRRHGDGFCPLRLRQPLPVLHQQKGIRRLQRLQPGGHPPQHSRSWTPSRRRATSCSPAASRWPT